LPEVFAQQEDVVGLRGHAEHCLATRMGAQTQSSNLVSFHLTNVRQTTRSADAYLRGGGRGLRSVGASLRHNATSTASEPRAAPSGRPVDTPEAHRPEAVLNSTQDRFGGHLDASSRR